MLQQVSVWYFQDLVLCFSKPLCDIFRIWSYVWQQISVLFSGFGPLFQQVPVWYFPGLDVFYVVLFSGFGTNVSVCAIFRIMVLCFSKSLYDFPRIWLYFMYFSKDLVVMFHQVCMCHFQDLVSRFIKSMFYFQDLVWCFNNSLCDIFRIFSYVSSILYVLFSGSGPAFPEEGRRESPAAF